MHFLFLRSSSAYFGLNSWPESPPSPAASIYLLKNGWRCVYMHGLSRRLIAPQNLIFLELLSFFTLFSPSITVYKPSTSPILMDIASYLGDAAPVLLTACAVFYYFTMYAIHRAFDCCSSKRLEFMYSTAFICPNYMFLLIPVVIIRKANKSQRQKDNDAALGYSKRSYAE